MKIDKGKHSIYLLGVACGILGIFVLVQYGLLYSSMRDRPIHAPFLSYFGLEQVERIEFDQRRATFFKKGKEWFLEAEGKIYQPDPKKLDRFFTILKSVRITLRDEATPLTMAWYGLKETLYITFECKGKVKRFLVGGIGPLGSEEYCVAEDRPFIYKLSDSLSFYALKKPEYWIGQE